MDPSPASSAVSLPVIPPKTGGVWRWTFSILARLYRVAVIGVIVWLIHWQHVRMRVDANAPIRVDEVKKLIPTAAQLSPDDSPRQGLFVFDAGGKKVGYVLRTSPMCDDVVGWSGPTDTMIVLDADMKIVGVHIRSTRDTKEHIETIVEEENQTFLKMWNGKTWEQTAGYDPLVAGIEGVSGASLTSMSIATSIYQRFKRPQTIQARTPPPFRLRADDWGVIAVIALSLAFSFTSLRSYKWIRRGYQTGLIVYLGVINGQILAQSLYGGWAANSVPWRTLPGLVLLAAAALVLPWATRRAVYCSQICPHGAAQELLGSLTRHRFHVKLPRGVDAGLRRLPFALLALILVFVMLNLPTHLKDHTATSDVATFEPFDAWAKARDIGRAGLIYFVGLSTAIIAIIGLVAAFFVPMAYCKYGCPTGALFAFVRSHGKADGFGMRDFAAGIMVLMAFLIYQYYDVIQRWIA